MAEISTDAAIVQCHCGTEIAAAIRPLLAVPLTNNVSRATIFIIRMLRHVPLLETSFY